MNKGSEDQPGEVEEKPALPPPPSSLYIALWIVAFCVFGMGQTFVNKLCMVSFPYPNTLLVVQCSTTVIFVLLTEKIPGMDIKVDPLRKSAVLRWLPLVILFIGLLASSLFALKYVTVSTLVVIRNASSLMVAFMEAFYLKKQTLTSELLISLVGILTGSIIYALTDWSFSLVGYFFLLLNLCSTSGYQIYVKILIADVKLTPYGMVYYNNLLSMFFFALAALIWESPFQIMWGELGAYTYTVIFISTIFGFGLSLAAFVLNVVITATSQMVINNLNKVVLIFMSEWYQRNMDARTGASAAVVLTSGFYYSYIKTVDPKSPPISFSTLNKAIVLFTVSVFVFFLVATPQMNSDGPSAKLNGLMASMKDRGIPSLRVAALTYDQQFKKEFTYWMGNLKIPLSIDDFGITRWGDSLKSPLSIPFEDAISLCPDVQRKLIHKMNREYLESVDVFLCSYPVSLCELFIPFNKPIIVYVTGPIEFGRESPERFMQFINNIKKIKENPQNIVVASSYYDQQMLLFYTEILVPIIPGIAPYVEIEYKPTINKYLLSAPFPEFSNIADELSGKFGVNFDWIERDQIDRKIVNTYKALILIPTAPSTHVLDEFYAMSMPIFAPSFDLMIASDWMRFMSIRTFWTKEIPSLHQGKVHNPISAAREDVKWWIEHSDIYQLTGIVHFSSLETLPEILKSQNLFSISNSIKIAYRTLEHTTLGFWAENLSNLQIVEGTIPEESSLPEATKSGCIGVDPTSTPLAMREPNTLYK